MNFAASQYGINEVAHFPKSQRLPYSPWFASVCTVCKTDKDAHSIPCCPFRALSSTTPVHFDGPHCMSAPTMRVYGHPVCGFGVGCTQHSVLSISRIIIDNTGPLRRTACRRRRCVYMASILPFGIHSTKFLYFPKTAVRGRFLGNPHTSKYILTLDTR